LNLSTVSDTRLDYRLNNSYQFTGDDDNSTILKHSFNQNHYFKPALSDSFLEIDGDETFIEKAIEYGWNGTGTIDNPIILDNITFSIIKATGSLIHIRNTRLHFIIQNYAFNGSDYNAHGWLYLYNVSNGNLFNNNISEFNYGFGSQYVTNLNIFQNNFSNNLRGISIEDGLDVKIRNNIFQDNIWDGMSFNKCNNSLIEQNSIKNNNENAIELYKGKNIQIINNSIENNLNNGVLSDRSLNLTINDNKFINNSIWLNNIEDLSTNYNPALEFYLHSIENNTINDYELLYFVNKNNLTIDPSDKVMKEIYLVNSTNIVLNGLKLSSLGIYYSNNTQLINTTLKQTKYGVYVHNSNNITMIGNLIENTSIALVARYNQNLTIIKNVIRFNEQGIYSHYCQNIIFNNNSIHNQASDGVNFLYIRSSVLEIQSNLINNNEGIGIKATFQGYVLIRNVIMFDNSIFNNNDGADISASNARIFNNRFINNTGEGLYTGHANIFNNIFQSNSEIGLHIIGNGLDVHDNAILENGIGIESTSLKESLIANNTIKNNSICGINFYRRSENVEIINNSFLNNRGNGLQGRLGGTGSSGRSIITKNIFMANQEYGIYLDTGGLETVHIYLNDFIDNNNGGTQAYQLDTRKIYWTKEFTGNFWSDYNGSDSDNDGLGDTPYVIDGFEEVFDLYPLLKFSRYFFNDKNPPLVNNPENNSLLFNGSFSFEIVWIVSDEHPKWYMIYVNEGYIESKDWKNGTINFLINITTPGLYTCKIIVVDVVGNSIENTVWIEVIAQPESSTSIIDTSFTASSSGTTFTSSSSSTSTSLSESPGFTVTTLLLLVIILIPLIIHKRGKRKENE
jgi:nitrous oxidase accessory protein NosD